MSDLVACLNCGRQSSMTAVECPFCGIIFKKWRGHRGPPLPSQKKALTPLFMAQTVCACFLVLFYSIMTGLLALPAFCLFTLVLWVMVLGKPVDKISRGFEFLYEANGYLVMPLIPFMVAGILAPFRALLMTVFQHAKTNETWAHVLFFPGREADMAMGLSGMYFGFAVLIFDGVWRLRQAGQITNLATSKAGAAAIGLSEFRGIARKAEPFSEESSPGQDMPSDAILFHRTEITRSGKQSETDHYEGWSRFYLEDDSGRILVDPGAAIIRLPLMKSFSRQLSYHSVMMLFFLGRRTYELILTRNFIEDPDRSLRYLRDGDPVYLIGNVEVNEKAGPDAIESDRLIVRPRNRRASDDNLLRVFFGMFGFFNRRYRREIDDVFFLSDTGEAQSRTSIFRGLALSVSIALVWIFLSWWLAFRCNAMQS